MRYEMTEEAVTTLVDERITVMTEPQTRRIDRLENALVQLADAQRRTEEAQKRTEEALVQLADAQRHMTHQLHNLTSVVNKVQQAQVTILQKQDAMEQTQVAMQKDMRTVQENQRAMQGDIRRLGNRVAKLAGDSLEERYLKHAGSYLGRVLRKARAFKPYVMEDQLRAKLSESDYEDLLLVDLLVRGIPKGHKGIHVWLAFEISVVVDRKDVERAVRRAEILRRCDFIAIPAVAGEKLTQGAEALASSEEVVIVTNGRIDHWKEAFARALAAKESTST